MFIDSHCHLSFKDLGSHGEQSLSIVEAARKDNILAILDIATDEDQFFDTINFASKIDIIFAALGIHPLHIEDNIEFTEEKLQKYINHKKVIAIGETGFDKYHTKDKIQLQKKFFDIHAKVSVENDLPIIIHSREAEKETLDYLLPWVKEYGLKGVIHCFTGDISFMKKVLDLGFMISFSGIITFNKSYSLQEVVKYVPLKNFLAETDAPFLAPEPYRGKINQPAYVKYTIQKIAEIKEMAIEAISEQLSTNFFTLFNRAKL